MVTRDAYLILVGAVALQRLLEAALSKVNERELIARGAVEHAKEQLPWMISLHAAWLAATVIEVVVLDRRFDPAIAAPALALFFAGQALRFSAMWALGRRWTVKVIVLPGAPAVTRGVFRWLRHPNYLGVILEIAALPLVCSAWITAVAFTIANAALLRARIRAEEAALAASGDYGEAFRDRPRLFPRPAR